MYKDVFSVFNTTAKTCTQTGKTSSGPWDVFDLHIPDLDLFRWPSHFTILNFCYILPTYWNNLVCSLIRHNRFKVHVHGLICIHLHLIICPHTLMLELVFPYIQHSRVRMIPEYIWHILWIFHVPHIREQ